MERAICVRLCCNMLFQDGEEAASSSGAILPAMAVQALSSSM